VVTLDLGFQLVEALSPTLIW